MSKLLEAGYGLMVMICFLAFAALNIWLILYWFPNTLAGRAIGYFFAAEKTYEVLEHGSGQIAYDCHSPLPSFTLGPDSDPSVSEVNQLCDCIWENLPNETRSIAENPELLNDDEQLIQLYAFSFGMTLRNCGGEDL